MLSFIEAREIKEIVLSSQSLNRVQNTVQIVKSREILIKQYI